MYIYIYIHVPAYIKPWTIFSNKNIKCNTIKWDKLAARQPTKYSSAISGMSSAKVHIYTYMYMYMYYMFMY